MNTYSWIPQRTYTSANVLSTAEFRQQAVTALPRRESLQVAGKLAPGWTMTRALNIIVEPAEDGSFIVSDDVLLVYGHGPNMKSALQDYQTSLIEYYEIIERSAKDHAPSASLLQLVKKYIARDESE
jgi:hypothetical protein